ncbi:MAG: zf-HC2 domain-containing protein [Clostridia bacterium]|nr:zf-HC2 domain-containing protein [Clostridia bacterium]
MKPGPKTTLNCTTVKPLLSEYLDEMLPAELASDVREHLRSCPSCRQEEETLAATIRAIKNMPAIDVPADFKVKLRRRLMEEKKRKSRALLTRWLPLTAAAVLCLGVMTHFFALGRGGGSLPLPNYQARLEHDYGPNTTPGISREHAQPPIADSTPDRPPAPPPQDTPDKHQPLRSREDYAKTPSVKRSGTRDNNNKLVAAGILEGAPRDNDKWQKIIVKGEITTNCPDKIWQEIAIRARTFGGVLKMAGSAEAENQSAQVVRLEVPKEKWDGFLSELKNIADVKILDVVSQDLEPKKKALEKIIENMPPAEDNEQTKIIVKEQLDELAEDANTVEVELLLKSTVTEAQQ